MLRYFAVIPLLLATASPIAAQERGGDPLDDALRQLDEMREQAEDEQVRDAIDDQKRRIQELRDRLEGLKEQQIELPDFEALQPAGLTFQGEALAITPYTDPLADAPRERVVALLADADYAVRRQAEAHLMADETLDREAIRGLLQAADAPEQRYRLLRVAEHHLMRQVREEKFGPDAKPATPPEEDGVVLRLSPSAAIGFSYAPVTAEDNPYADTAGVAVISTMPGFPGHARLQVGDLVIAIGGQTAQSNRIRNRDWIAPWFSDLIQAYQPGETIVLTVIRGGRALDIPVVGVEGAALADMYKTDEKNAAFREQPYTTAWLLARQDLTRGLAQPAALVPAE